MPKTVHGAISVHDALERRHAPWVETAREPVPVVVEAGTLALEALAPDAVVLEPARVLGQLRAPVPLAALDELDALVRVRLAEVRLRQAHVCAAELERVRAVDGQAGVDAEGDVRERHVEQLRALRDERRADVEAQAKVVERLDEHGGLAVERVEAVRRGERERELIVELFRQREPEVVVGRVEGGIAEGGEDVRAC